MVTSTFRDLGVLVFELSPIQSMKCEYRTYFNKSVVMKIFTEDQEQCSVQNMLSFIYSRAWLI